MAHDLDVDFSCWDWTEHLRIKKAMLKAGFTGYRVHGKPNKGFEQRFKWHNVGVDIFHFYDGTIRAGRAIEDPNVCWQGSWDRSTLIVSEFPKDIVRETVPLTFQGITVPIPIEFEAMLVARYGDWTEPVTKWNWRTDPKCIVTEPPPISVEVKEATFLIKSFLRPHLLMRCVRSIRATYRDVPILVVDDGDLHEGYEKQLADKNVKLLRLPYDSGLSAGRNAGVKEIETPFTVVVDDDMVIARRARVPDMLRLLEHADVVCGAMRQNNSILRWEGHYEFTDDGGLKLNPYEGGFDAVSGIRSAEVDFALNILAARTEFLAEHPWDEQLKVAEHTDWFLSLRKAKARVLFAPDCVFDHKPQKDKQYREMRRRPEFRLRFFHKYGFKYHIGYYGHRDNWTAKDQQALEALLGSTHGDSDG